MNKALAERVFWDEKKGLFIVKIELSETYQNFRVEVIFRIFNHLTFPKNEDVISKYLESYPYARPLYLIIRSLVHQIGLDNPGQNGINNFSLFLMIVAFCQKFEALSSDQSHPLPQENTSKSPSMQCKPNIEPVQKEVSGFSRRSASSQPCDKIGDLLVKFLYFYGYTFDYLNLYICPSLPDNSLKESFFQVN